MNHVTCDDVFDALTRAPFPSGTEFDQAVDDHISVCHECRRLAEALRPATDLLSEAMSAQEQASLPAYRGQVAAVMERVRQEALHRPAAAAAGKVAWYADKSALRRGWVPSIVVALLLLIAVTRGPGAADVPRERAGIGAGASPSQGREDADTTCLLAGFALRPDCLPPSIVGPPRKPVLTDRAQHDRAQHDRAQHDRAQHAVDQPIADQQLAGTLRHLMACRECHEDVRVTRQTRVCCTNCHSAKMPTTLAKLPLPRLTASCKACHG